LSVDVVFGLRRNRREALQRELGLAELRMHRRQVVPDPHVVGGGGQHQAELGRRTLELALLEVDEPHLGTRLARVGVGALHLRNCVRAFGERRCPA
jgi:hypothetical protein